MTAYEHRDTDLSFSFMLLKWQLQCVRVESGPDSNGDCNQDETISIYEITSSAHNAA